MSYSQENVHAAARPGVNGAHVQVQNCEISRQGAWKPIWIYSEKKLINEKSEFVLFPPLCAFFSVELRYLEIKKNLDFFLVNL